MASRRVVKAASSKGQRGQRSTQTPVTPVAAESPIVERISVAPDDRLLVSPTEAARRLSIGRTLVYDLLRRGELPSITIGVNRRIPVAALNAYVQAALAREGYRDGYAGMNAGMNA